MRLHSKITTIISITCLTFYSYTCSATVEESDSSSNFYGGANIKQWISSFTPSGGSTSSVSSSLLTLLAGYKNTFLTFTIDLNKDSTYTDPVYPGGSLKRAESSIGIGYSFTPNFKLIAGGKAINNIYPNTKYEGNTLYYTLAALGSWNISDTPWTVFGNYAYGTGISDCNCGQGTVEIGSTNTFSGYEIGMSYQLNDSFTANFGYKHEVGSETAMDKISKTLLESTITRNGPFIGIGVSF